MRLLAAFVSHEVTTQLRSTRFRILAVAYAAIAVIPAIAIYISSRNLGYRLDTGAYAAALRMLQPALTALFATVLAVDAITREREEGSFGVVSLAPVSASGYFFRRWLALLAIAVPLSMIPGLAAAGLAGYAGRAVPNAAPLAWDWLLRVAPPLVLMSALMLALGTITGRTILAVLAYGAAATFGLGFLQDLLALSHRHLEGPGSMMGFDPMAFNQLLWAAKGWWWFEPPTAAGYPLETELDRVLPESALLVAAALLVLGIAPAFLRSTRPDVKPWRIRDDHPLRTMLRGINRIRENYRPDAGLQPADRVVLAVALLASIACVALLLRRETRFINLARERFAAESADEPYEMSVALFPRSIAIEGDAGRTVRTRTTFAFENRGDEPEGHLGFALHPALGIETVGTTCGRARVTRVWERVGLDLETPLAPNAKCSITFYVAGKPDSVVFQLPANGRFGTRFRFWERATKAIELSDLSRSTFIPATTRAQLMLAASDFAPVPRYTPWDLDGKYVDRDQDTSSFVPEGIAPASDVRVSLRLPDGFTAADSCGTVAAKTLDSRCVFGFADFRISAARFTTMSLGRSTLVHLQPHDQLARIHAPAVAEAIPIAERAWPGLRLGGTPVFVERPIRDDGHRANWYGRSRDLIEASGSLYFIPEWAFIRLQPLQAPQIAASLIGSTLRGRRPVRPEEQMFFRNFFGQVAATRAGSGETRTATIAGRGPRPSSFPLLQHDRSGYPLDRLRGVLVDLEYRVGGDHILDGINEFVSMPGTGSAKELLDVIGRRANVSLDNMYRDYFTGEAIPRLTLEEATFVRDDRRWVVRGFARNLAGGESLCPIVLRTELGSVRQMVTIGAGARVPFTLTTEHTPRTLQLDPDKIVYRHAAIGTVDSIDFKGES